jgi:hypothetical protein
VARPERTPGLLAAVEASVSSRVAKRVKENPALAEAWGWSVQDGTTEVTAEDVTVRLVGGVLTQTDVSCSCLMAPKCVHVLAVLTALAEHVPGAAAEAGAVAETGAAAEAGDAHPPLAPPSDEPLLAPAGPGVSPAGTRQAWVALAGLLALGAHGADTVTRAELGRLAYEARSAGLHRLGRAMTRVVRSLRLLEAGHPSFALATLVADLAEALVVARGLGAAATPDLVGEARRSYTAAGNLRLWGLVSEPVLAGSGQAGVVTWLVDGRGRRWQVADVRPRARGQAIGVYDVAPALTTLTHRRMCREGLFVQNATAADGRLGAGADVSAVRASGVGWDADPLAAAWTAAPDAGLDGLRFVAGTIRGLWRDSLVIATPSGDVLVLPGSEHGSLPWRDNLRLLARAPGLIVKLVGRVVPDRPRAVVGLGVASDTLLLPDDWAGRVNLGLDRLSTAHLPARTPAPIHLEGDAEAGMDPLAALRRRVERAALGGTASLPGEAFGAVARDVARLRGAMAIGGADLLAALATAARGPGFATAWLAAATYLAAADAERARRAWT